MKFLIDTGANKNYINPKHVKKSSTGKTSTIQTVNGKFNVNKFIKFNPFPESKYSKAFEFFVLDFHNYFDGLIGYESLQNIKATIDADKNQINFPDFSIKMKRKFPGKKEFNLNIHETKFLELPVKMQTGDFFLENDIEIQPSVFIHSGIYNANNGKAFMAVSNYSDNKVTFQSPEIETELNNFETREPTDGNCKINKNLFDKLRLQHLNEEEKKIILNVIANNQNCFHSEGDELTFTSALQHIIRTKDEIPIHTKSYRYPYCHKNEVKSQIKEMLKLNTIRHSTSPYSSPIWIVPKKPDASGKQKWRLVIDYRKLNEKTIDDRYPIPNITDMFDKLGKSNLFTTLDLFSGFWQIEVHSDSIQKTAFSVENGHYEFLKMPFGLKNAPATFQRVMDHVLRKYIGKICVIYLDDILVFSTSPQEHAENLEKILKALAKFNLKIQLDKCEFMKKECAFLGHIIADGIIKPNPEKIRAIKQWPIPKNEKELRGFLGTLGYYRKFIRDFAKIVKPLTAQLRKGENLNHTKEFIETFERCKQILTTSDVLQRPDFSKPFVLTTDASNFAIGSVLSQGPIGRDKPVAFFSRTLSKAEENYSTIEKELLAIVASCKYFRPYLFGKKFTLFTDHQPLVYIYNMKNPSSKLVRWRLSLEEFDYEIKYRKGTQNVVADGLSRIKIEPNEINTSENSSERESMQNNADSSDGATVHSADTDDSHFLKMTLEPINSFSNQLILEIANNSETNIEQPFPKTIRVTVKKPTFSENDIIKIFKEHLDYKKSNCIFCAENIMPVVQKVYRNFFCRNNTLKICISQTILTDIKTPEEENEVIEKTHNRAHRGINENVLALKQIYFFPSMKNKVRNFIELCTTCKTAKYDRKPYKLVLSKPPIPTKPLEVIHIDIFISGPNHFLSAVDKFSRFGMLIPIKSRSIVDVRKGLIKLFATFNQPGAIVSDNESSFTSVEIKTLFENLNIERYYTPVNRSQVNGIVERFHSTIAEIFRCIKDQYDNLSPKSLWQLATSHYNATIHSAHKLKPASVFYGIKHDEVRPEKLEAILENKEKFFEQVNLELEKTQKLNLENHNKNREKEPDLKTDECVYIARQGIKSKTQPKFLPVIVAQNNSKTFLDSKSRKLHKSNLKRKPK